MTTTAPTLPRLLALAALPLGLAAAALAQTATTPSYLPTKEETVQLEKFLVNDQREKSYASRRSLTATKTDTALIDVPHSLTVVTRELTLHGTCGSAGEYPLCLDLIARGVIRVEPMISAVAPLADGAAWFEKLSAKDGSKFMKVILTP